MATLGGALTLADWASRVNNDGKIAGIVELLSMENEILEDMLWIEGNLPTGHKTTVRTGIPQGTWRLLNYGVPLGKSTTAPIVDTCGNLEAESQIDIDLAKLNGNTATFRLSESKAFIQGMGQQMASTLIYGSTAITPERFTGFAPRFNTLNTANAESANNVIDAGGTGNDNTSIWIITWGPDTVHGIFPKGSRSGLQHMDKGEHRVADPNGNPYYAYVDHYKWECGLTVRDWRYCVRVANIDVSELAGANGANLVNLLIRAMYRMPTTSGGPAPIVKSDAPGISGQMGRTVIYCNRTVRAYLDLQSINKNNVLFTTGVDQQGKPWTMFRGIPIKNCDAILNTEARVVV